jgi:hypothetical protein
MKTLLTLSLVVLLAGSAFAQLDNSLGIFFVDSNFDDDFTNFDPTPGVAFNAYIAIVSTTVSTVGGYEVGIDFTEDAFILAVTGPNGWTNFGAPDNHICGFQTPVPSESGNALLATMNILYTGSGLNEIFMGPSEPSSFNGEGPGIADGTNPDLLYMCNYTSGPDFGGLVATLNGDGIVYPDVVATEAHSLSSVKALFN